MIHGVALVAVTVGLALGTLLAPPPPPAQARRPQLAVLRDPTPPLTRALNIPSPVCTVAGWLSGLAGTLCSVARKGGELLGAGGKLVGSAGTATKVIGVAAVLAGLTAWVTGAGHAILAATATVIANTTRPQLESSWFSSSYWRMAAIGMLLTVPFLFAACVQGLLRSDPSLIGRAALGYLPLAVLGICIAAPLTTLLLSASDGLSTLITGAAGEAPGAALGKLGLGTGLLAGVSRSTFIAFVIGFVTVAATLTLWVELLIRAAAVYVIVLMLPVVFAALVWPARRVWAIRSAETLVALILAKFAIVAVLSLGAAAIGHHANPGVAGPLVGVTLVMLAAFSPWALLRLLPLHELAAGVGGLSAGLSRPMSMLDAPAPPPAAERPAPPDSRPDAGTDDAARQMVGELNGRRAGAADPGETTRGPTADADAASGGGSGAPPGSEAASGRGPSAAGTAGSERERLPGMESRWQRRNGSWPTHELGPGQFAGEALSPESATEPLPEAAPAPLPLDPPPPLGRVDPPGNPDEGER